jgi:hypothetical protein
MRNVDFIIVALNALFAFFRWLAVHLLSLSRDCLTSSRSCHTIRNICLDDQLIKIYALWLEQKLGLVWMLALYLRNNHVLAIFLLRCYSVEGETHITNLLLYTATFSQLSKFVKQVSLLVTSLIFVQYSWFVSTNLIGFGLFIFVILRGFVAEQFILFLSRRKVEVFNRIGINSESFWGATESLRFVP